MSLDNVLGHKETKEFFRAMLARDRLGDAYLFVGPDGVGKTLFAREFSKALLCSGKGDRPCDACHNCHLVDGDRHPDLNLIQAAEGKRAISIEQIRECGRYLSLRPVQADHRIVILREADHMAEPAANALLKTLEEPPPYGVLILTTDRPGVLLPTIRSRCQEILFGPLTADQILQILSARSDLEQDDVRGAAQFAEGSAGKAIQVLESGCLEIYSRLLPRMLALPADSTVELSDEILAWARSLSSNREVQRQRVRELLRLLSCAYRDILVLCLDGPHEVLFNTRAAKRLAPAAERLQSEDAMRILDALWDARWQTDRNADLSLVLDNLLAKVASLQAGNQRQEVLT